MKLLLGAALAASVLLGGAVGVAQAQTAERVYDNGPVWVVSYVETKPGMFDDYMAYLAGPWRAVQELGKKHGDILDYKVLSLADPRDHEADVMLLIEYKNMGVFDRSLDDLDKDNNAVFSSSVKSNQMAVKREDVRVLRGSVTAREVKFK